VKPSQSKTSRSNYDPGELEDLIHNPAVGCGVGSHLLAFRGPQLIAPGVVATNQSTVDKFADKPTRLPQPAQSSAGIWMSESGEAILQGRVRPIRSLDDVLNKAEKAIYRALLVLGEELPDGDRMTCAGYHELCQQTRLSRKTIQRVVAKLIQKGLVLVGRQADIYTQRPTEYRVRSESAALREMASRGRSHSAKIGPGYVFVYRES
jgi:DNA-binding MarR family transcriptional regulator